MWIFKNVHQYSHLSAEGGQGHCAAGEVAWFCCCVCSPIRACTGLQVADHAGLSEEDITHLLHWKTTVNIHHLILSIKSKSEALNIRHHTVGIAGGESVAGQNTISVNAQMKG